MSRPNKYLWYEVTNAESMHSSILWSWRLSLIDGKLDQAAATLSCTPAPKAINYAAICCTSLCMHLSVKCLPVHSA